VVWAEGKETVEH